MFWLSALVQIVLPLDVSGLKSDSETRQQRSAFEVYPRWIRFEHGLDMNYHVNRGVAKYLRLLPHRLDGGPSRICQR